MAEVPSLSEITNISVDPERGSGTPAVVFDNTALLNSITNAANQKAQYDWAKYNTFRKEMSDVYGDLSKISQIETANEDKPMLRKELADIYKEIGKNPQVFSGKNPEILANIQQRLAQVSQKSIQSKQDNLYDKAHRNYLIQNPELNNDTNRMQVDSYLKKPLGQRDPYTFDITPVFDVDTMAANINKNSTQTFDETRLIGGKDEKGNYLPGDRFILPRTRTTVDPKKFMSQWSSLYDYQQDKRGSALRDWVNNAWKNSDRTLYPTPKDLWNAIGQSKMGKDSITEKEFKANPNAFKDDELALKKQDIAQGWERLNISKRELNKQTEGEQKSAFGVLNEMTEIINASDRPENQVTVVDPNTGRNKTLFTLNDASLLSTFGKIDKDGKTFNVPDEARFDKETGEIDLVYFEKDDNGNIKRNRSGGKWIDKSHRLNARSWANEIAQRTYAKNDAGKINELVQAAITNGGGNLYDVAKRLKTANPSGSSPSPKKMEIRRSEINARASAAGYTPKEYETLLVQKGIKIVE